MKILILGATGMLGHKLFQTLRKPFPQTYATLHGAVDQAPYAGVELFRHGNVIENVNATDLERLKAMLDELQPHYVINCVGLIKQRAEAEAFAQCMSLNAFLPHQLALICSRWGGRLIHFSTDCVFDGRRGQYTETDATNAQDCYGLSKALGEVTTINALTLRTSIIGRELAHHQSLLEWFLRQDHRHVRGFTQAIYSGVTTNYLADVVCRLLRDKPALSGLYQVTAPAISKHDLLCLLREAYGLDMEIEPDASFRCDRSMSGAKFQQTTGITPPAWPALVAQLKNDSTPYEQWKENYEFIRRQAHLNHRGNRLTWQSPHTAAA